MTAWASGRVMPSAAPSAAPCLRVLTYHRCGPSAYDPFCVTRRAFAAQMRHLAEHELAISLRDLESFLSGTAELRSGSVLVTIDDGFRSVCREMLPVLKQYAVPAVAFITPSLIDSRPEHLGSLGPCGELPEDYLTWDEIGALAAQGITIGSHGWTHRSLGRLSPAEIRDEAGRSRDLLEARLGCRVTSFAYPYGTRADFNRTTAMILAEAGYTTVFTSQHGAIARGADPIELPRIKVEGGEGLWMFRLLCHGAMDGWRLVDRMLWHWQRPRR